MRSAVPQRMRCLAASPRGFSLLEVLVSMVVFSVGLLGLAALQIQGTRTQHAAYLYAVANVLAQDMQNRMQANRQGTGDGHYHNPSRNASGQAACLGLSSGGQPSETASCSPADMAAHDLYEWYGMLEGQAATSWHPEVPAMLPNASGVVCIDSNPYDGTPDNPGCNGVVPDGEPPVYAIKIWWQARGQDSPQRLVQAYTAPM